MASTSLRQTTRSLICRQYAAFKRFAPAMDIGIDLSREYEPALELLQKKQND
ncbi:MAG: hypothetical protein WD492_18085 [Alkalispirochaeta sp.]